MIVLMAVYSVLRLGFYFYHHQLYVHHSLAEVTLSFLHGIRFDLAALCWINAAFFILAMVPRVPRIILKTLFYIVNASFIIGCLNDYELFSFSGKRLSKEFFTSLGEDFWQQLPQVFLHYWYLPIAGVVSGWLLWIGDSRLESKISDKRVGWRAAITAWILVPGLVFMAIRGGLQFKSIHVQNAFTQGANELGHLTLNTPYHFLRTFKAPIPPKKTWFSDEELVSKLKALTPPQSLVGHSGDNVVLLILESFSLESYEQGMAPFLRELAGRGVFISQNFANGRRSIEVLSSLIDGIPSVQDVPFSKSAAQSMALEGSASKLKAAGYSTAFFHGAERGSMGFESYTLAHGFQRYHSREDYDGPKTDYDGQWGIYDGPWLKYALREFSKLKPPFFTGLFTLSSHQPYAIPKEWAGKFPKGTLEIHESMGYTDQMLREFFGEAEKLPWYKDTLFIITADHTQKLASAKYTNSVGVYRVPLILFHPTQKLPSDINTKTTEHVDMPATVLDWVNVPAQGLNLLGESVFAPGPGKALQYLQPGWQYIKGTEVFIWNEESSAGQEYGWNPDTGELRDQNSTGLKDEAKLYIQYLLNSFKQNRWPVSRSE